MLVPGVLLENLANLGVIASQAEILFSGCGTILARIAVVLARISVRIAKLCLAMLANLTNTC